LHLSVFEQLHSTTSYVKRDPHISKETHTYEKRPAYMKRDLHISKETHSDEKRPTDMRRDA